MTAGNTVRECRFAGLDFESAGERVNEAGIPVQIGIAWMTGVDPVPSSFYGSYLKADRPVAWSAQRIHGISDDDLKGAPSLLSLWPEIKGRLEGRWIVAHGSGTEKRFLRAFPMHGFGPWVDTLTLSRKILPGRPSYALSDLVRGFGMEEELGKMLPAFRWHEAVSDAVASLLLLKKLIATARIDDHPAGVLLMKG